MAFATIHEPTSCVAALALKPAARSTSSRNRYSSGDRGLSDDREVLALCTAISARRRQIAAIESRPSTGDSAEDFGPLWYTTPLTNDVDAMMSRLVDLTCTTRAARRARAQVVVDGFFPLGASVGERLAYALASDLLKQR